MSKEECASKEKAHSSGWMQPVHIILKPWLKLQFLGNLQRNQIIPGLGVVSTGKGCVGCFSLKISWDAKQMHGDSPANPTARKPSPGQRIARRWPWGKTQIVPPVNIRFNPTTKIGSLKWVVNSPNNPKWDPIGFDPQPYLSDRIHFSEPCLSDCGPRACAFS